MDHITDNNPRTINHILKNFKVPEYVKDMETISKSASEEEAIFADPDNREFPIHTAGNVWLGYGYAKLNKNHVAATILKSAAKHYGIQDDIKQFDNTGIEKYASEHKREYGFIVQDSENRKEYLLYPLNSANEVRESCRQLAKEANYHDFEDFVVISKRLVKAAKKYEVSTEELHPIISRYGIEREFQESVLKELIDSRVELVKDADLKEVYNGCMDIIMEDESKIMEAINMIKSADAIAGIDYKHHTDPYLAAFSGMEKDDLMKLATEFIVTKEFIIPKSAFESVPQEELNTYLTKTAADSYKYMLSKSNSEFADFIETRLDEREFATVIKLALKHG